MGRPTSPRSQLRTREYAESAHCAPSGARRAHRSSWQAVQHQLFARLTQRHQCVGLSAIFLAAARFRFDRIMRETKAREAPRRRRVDSSQRPGRLLVAHERCAIWRIQALQRRGGSGVLRCSTNQHGHSVVHQPSWYVLADDGVPPSSRAVLDVSEARLAGHHLMISQLNSGRGAAHALLHNSGGMGEGPGRWRSGAETKFSENASTRGDVGSPVRSCPFVTRPSGDGS